MVTVTTPAASQAYCSSISAVAAAASCTSDRVRAMRVSASAGSNGKQNLIPHRDVAGGLALLANLAGFQIAEVADVVHGLIAAAHGKRRLARGGQPGSARKNRIEDHALAGVAFAPHAEVAREHFAQRVAGASRRLESRARWPWRSACIRCASPCGRTPRAARAPPAAVRSRRR